MLREAELPCGAHKGEDQSPKQEVMTTQSHVHFMEVHLHV